MKKVIFGAVFAVNVIWGVIFMVLSGLDHHYVGTDGQYQCDMGYQTYCNDPKSPVIFGSKPFAYYTAFVFFNPSDTEDRNGVPQVEYCEPGGDWQELLFIPLFLLWLVPLIISTQNARARWYCLAVTTFLSGIGFAFIFQMFMHNMQS